MNREFVNIVKYDIELCAEAIRNNRKIELSELSDDLEAKYGNIIDGFCQNLYPCYEEEDSYYMKRNISMMKQKLELFMAMGCENKFATNSSAVTYNNTNQVIVDISISFEEARKKVESMSALEDKEIEEILDKISQIEDVYNSANRKTKKWEMVKGIIKWVADKGIDVAKILLPLVLKVGE